MTDEEIMESVQNQKDDSLKEKIAIIYTPHINEVLDNIIFLTTVLTH